MNAGTFQIGEIALLQNLPYPFKHMNGEECEIAGALEMRALYDIYGNRATRPSYEIVFQGVNGAVLPEHLKKKPEKPIAKDTEFGKTVDWSDCAWQPEKVAA